MNELTERILTEINSVVIGKENVTAKVLMAIIAKGHVLLEDVPGVGKTTLAVTFARTLGLDSRRVQFTSDTMPSDVLGYSVYNKTAGDFEFKPGAVMTNLLLADEINRTSSKTQSALLEAMEEYHVTVDGKTYPLPEPFVVLATQNPVGSAGTTLLPASQMDRFMIRTSMGYPDVESQISILRDRHHENPVDRIQAVTDRAGVLALTEQAAQTHIADSVYAYVVSLVERTRNHEMIELGISPRGTLAVCRMAKSHAFLAGRDFVTPEDVISVFPDVCCHRLVLSAKARMHRCSAADVIGGILQEVPIPQLRGTV